jgi:hypothetical protein
LPHASIRDGGRLPPGAIWRSLALTHRAPAGQWLRIGLSRAGLHLLSSFADAPFLKGFLPAWHRPAARILLATEFVLHRLNQQTSNRTRSFWMFIYLISVEDRLRAKKIVKVPYFNGPTKEVEFVYGVARVNDPALADYLVERKLATKDFRQWGVTNLVHGVSLAAVASGVNMKPKMRRITVPNDREITARAREAISGALHGSFLKLGENIVD